jgi:hypothetical protein
MISMVTQYSNGVVHSGKCPVLNQCPCDYVRCNVGLLHFLTC